jgi:hypothetical protein
LISSKRTSSLLPRFQYNISVTNITYARPRPLQEVHLVLCISSVAADSLQCHFGMDGSRTFSYDEALLGLFVSQPSPSYAQ